MHGPKLFNVASYYVLSLPNYLYMQYDEARKRRYEKVVKDAKKSLAESEAKVKRYVKLVRDFIQRIKLLSKAKSLEESKNPNSVHIAHFDAKIDCVLKMYFRCVRRLYKVIRQRAVLQAKKDFYEAKLDPEWSYTDKYASRPSFYLSPIQEEEEAEQYYFASYANSIKYYKPIGLENS